VAREIVEVAPWSFIRGCIRTDDCVFVNRTDVHREKPYDYLSYDFSHVDGHRRAVAASLRSSRCLRPEDAQSEKTWRARINRRSSVALMLENVGLKE
jgi:hypothetical protein